MYWKPDLISILYPNPQKNKLNYLMAATTIFKVAREMAKNIAEAIIAEKNFRGEFGPASWRLLWLLCYRFWIANIRLTRERPRRIRSAEISRVGEWIRVRVWIRTIARPVAWASALVATSGRCFCRLHSLSLSCLCWLLSRSILWGKVVESFIF